jgi:hypothetical protein
MKGKLILALLVFGFVFVGCGTINTAQSQAQQQLVSGNKGFVNDRRFDGRWQSPDQEWELEFYADTYILYTDKERAAAGIFNYTGNEIDCQIETGMHFVLGYSLTGSQLEITSVGGVPDSFLGQWEKMNMPDSSETNPLVGTWKCKTDEGFTFYQFYPDGTGRSYDCNDSFTNMTVAGDITYDLNASTINGLLEGDGFSVPLINASFSLNGDELTQGKLILKRQ